MDGEIRRLRDVMPLPDFPLRTMDCPFDGREKILWRPVRCIGGCQQHAPGLEDGQSGGHEPAVILFGTERAVLLRLRERRRVEDDGVKRAPFFRQPPQPVEGIAVDEIVRRRIQAVPGEVALAPLEIFF